MAKFRVLVFGFAILLFVGWYGYRSFVHNQTRLPLTERAEAAPEHQFTKKPDVWNGKIDYPGLDRQILALAKRPEMAGLSVAIVEDGEVRFVKTYGVTDKRSGELVTPHTVFRWASVSKGVAGSLAAKLSEQGKLDLGATLNQWKTSLVLPRSGNSKISLAQLMSHQTGLTKNAYDRSLEGGESPVMLRTKLGTTRLQCEPGTCHSYQNIAFDAASEILGQSADVSYAVAARRQLFEPLGMESARFGMTGLTGADSWARPHRRDKVRPLSASYWRVPAAAGVSSNIVDMARWLRAQMGENKGVLSDAELALAHSPLVRTGRVYGGDLARALKRPSYGLGWRSFSYRGRALVGHSGAVDGYRATMIFDPAARTGIVAMWNSGWGMPFRIPFAALDSYYGQAASDEPANDWLDLTDIPLPKPLRPSRRDER